MKKVLFFLMLCISSNSLWAQHRYKVEYDLTLTAPRPINNQVEVLSYNIFAYNNNTRLGGLYIGSAVYLNPLNMTKDEVIEYNVEMNRFGHQSMIDGGAQRCGDTTIYFDDYDGSCTFFQYLGFCDTPRGINGISKIEDLTTLNQTTITEGAKVCEGADLVVFGCGLLSYSVDYLYNGQQREMLSYGKHPGTFSFDMADIPGLQAGEPFDLVVKYVDNPTSAKDQSSVGFQFVECSPNLVGTPTPSDTSC
ncbi:hypothetical protein M0D21_22660, partial [Aquimarina sp. D1M17]|uniref:hypothetical protein n=1 Tax=Aquimarina acroporae TaxID=2937283 RepID=UPI0020C027CB